MRTSLLFSFVVFTSLLFGGSLEANALEVNVLNQTEILRGLDIQIREQKLEVDEATKYLNDAKQAGHQQEIQNSESALEGAKGLLESLQKQRSQVTDPLLEASQMCT